METDYQKQVNSLEGALGPIESAFWKGPHTIVGNPASMSNAPLTYATDLGYYVSPGDNSAWKPEQIIYFGKSSRKRRSVLKKKSSRTKIKNKFGAGLKSVKKTKKKLRRK